MIATKKKKIFIKKKESNSLQVIKFKNVQLIKLNHNVLRIWDVNQLNFKNDVNLKFSNPMVSIESLCALQNGI